MVSQMTVFLDVTPYNLILKSIKHLHLNDGMNVQNPFASLADLYTYQITRRHLIKHRFFNTSRETQVSVQF